MTEANPIESFDHFSRNVGDRVTLRPLGGQEFMGTHGELALGLGRGRSRSFSASIWANRR